MLEFTANREQSNALYSLAYWVADENFIRERYGNEEPEIQTCRKTILDCCFPECDRLHIPFWVQNSVIVFSDDWRRYISTYLDEYLREKNIYIYII